MIQEVCFQVGSIKEGEDEEPQQFGGPTGLLPADCPPIDHVSSAAGDRSLPG